MDGHCPECGFVNPEGANYCQKCGAYLSRPDGKDEPTTMTYTVDESGEMQPVDIDEMVEKAGAALVIRSGGGRAGESFTLEEVVDDGHSFRGTQEILEFLRHAGSQFCVPVAAIGARLARVASRDMGCSHGATGESEQRAAAADLDIVRMSTQAEHIERARRRGQRDHALTI